MSSTIPSFSERHAANAALVESILPSNGPADTVDLRPHLTTPGKIVRPRCDHRNEHGGTCGKDSSYAVVAVLDGRPAPRTHGRCAKHLGALLAHYGRRGDFASIAVVPTTRQAAA